ncbi:MAG: hypothetical protein BZY80_00785 [SAR202 cluster bacterium Io17-Chloro-G2]|nr:MAG: hypothetical protein BZY80_00785 [SAR202 cluster bacterium Io17-Chloro-G2]
MGNNQHAERALMSHLLRRAGFGATPDELDTYIEQGYEATVEQLLRPKDGPALHDEDLIRRYQIDQNSLMLIESSQAYWLYRMINTRRPLEEKMALFWHGLFATAYGKLNHAKAVVNQTNTFRRRGLDNFHTLLMELSRDPAMIFWLDNKDNHNGAPNENYGRELLELFSMGIGNYTEDDVKACARAFSGWTIANAEYMSIRASRDSIWPHGRLDWQFQYRPEDHDDGEKTFLGHTGRFNGEDIIDIICRHPATAWFVASKLYNFFVADTADEPAIQRLADEFTRTNGNIESVMRTLFHSDFFRSEKARFARVKSPAELVAGAARLTGNHQFPDWSIVNLAMDANYMGQEILNPPSVEGWHTGVEWVDTGTLVERVNSAAKDAGDINQPGVRAIIQRLRGRGDTLSPKEFVEACLELAGGVQVSPATFDRLASYVSDQGDLRFARQDIADCSEQRVADLLQLIVSTREYQLA